MSMRDYAVVDYGIVLNNLVDSDILEELAENDTISNVSSFTGEAFEVCDSGDIKWGNSYVFSDETIYYVSSPKNPSLFKAAYRDIDDLLQACMKAYNRVGGLPKITDKDIRDRIRYICGTYYG